MSSIIASLSSAASTVASLPGQAVRAFSRSSTTTKVLVVASVAVGLAAVAAAASMDPTTSTFGKCLDLADKMFSHECSLVLSKTGEQLDASTGPLKEAYARYSPCKDFLETNLTFVPTLSKCLKLREEAFEKGCHDFRFLGWGGPSSFDPAMKAYNSACGFLGTIDNPFLRHLRFHEV